MLPTPSTVSISLVGRDAILNICCYLVEVISYGFKYLPVCYLRQVGITSKDGRDVIYLAQVRRCVG